MAFGVGLDLHFIKREDVLAVLPTGCGKSLIFQLVPKVCSYGICMIVVSSYPKAAIVVVICPLNALIDLLEDDVASHSIAFTSPELIVREEKWR